MSLEIDVLRVLLRLSRRRAAPTLDDLVVRLAAEAPAIRRALAGLARSGLVQRTPLSCRPRDGVRLTLAGLAVAVACAGRPRRRASTTSPMLPRVLPAPSRKEAAPADEAPLVLRPVRRRRAA